MKSKGLLLNKKLKDNRCKTFHFNKLALVRNWSYNKLLRAIRKWKKFIKRLLIISKLKNNMKRMKQTDFIKSIITKWMMTTKMMLKKQKDMIWESNHKNLLKNFSLQSFLMSKQITFTRDISLWNSIVRGILKLLRNKLMIFWQHMKKEEHVFKVDQLETQFNLKTSLLNCRKILNISANFILK